MAALTVVSKVVLRVGMTASCLVEQKAAWRDYSMAANSVASKAGTTGEQKAATWAERTAANWDTWKAVSKAVH